ncbi:tRNA dihydrouridine(20/20a) synthase DusA [Pokkaliibacter sp. CJK22405]|uniref:tRNA dihydrouridine(20/20a) synthase DusA n=1 Tax=Pokkaliibacter sp. CJK22405 TaxID=3384615 RepID=UPI003984D3FA
MSIPAPFFPDQPNRRFSIAPMMDWTDKHYRTFARHLTRHTLLYTEMVTTGAILHGDAERHLSFNAPFEHPIAVQLGGSNPNELAKAAKLCEAYGYDEINLNVGCPSDRVQNNMIGACLMAHPELVAECVAAMKSATSLPVTVKHRIGIDDQDSYDFLVRFVDIVKSAGCSTFIAHARKAILSGLSPKENREIPPLDYSRVYQLKKDFSDLEIIINGGIKTLDEAEAHLEYVDGVMVGREAYGNPTMLMDVDRRLFNGQNPSSEMWAVLEEYTAYVERHLENGGKLNHITRHLLGAFNGIPGGRKFRRHLSENATRAGASLITLRDAIALVERNQDQA